MILDGGPVGIGIESTIIDLTEETPLILRPGFITQEMLSAVLGKKVALDPGLDAPDDARKPKAPGMKYRHYAPRAELIIVDGAPADVVREINARTKKNQAEGKRTVVIASDETAAAYEAADVLRIGRRGDEEAAAKHLYKLLRECDALGADAVYSESFSAPGLGEAVMNRLLKAAGHTVVRV